MDFDIPMSDDEVDAAKMAVIEANGITDGYVRAFCWRGSEMMAVSAQNDEDPCRHRGLGMAELFRP